MIIGKYIRTLLQEGKRVILPGFGNLEMKQAEGGQAPSGKRINPPGASIRFDSGFSKDDDMLAGVLSEGEKLDMDEARQRTLELVDAIKFSLDKGEDYLLPDAGTFSRDEDGKITFQAEPDWILEPDQYGLEAMDLLELDELPSEEEVEAEIAKDEEEEKEEETEKVEETIKAGETELKEETGKAEKVDKTPEPAVKKEAKVTTLAPPAPQAKSKAKRWRVIWLVAATLIVVLVVLILIPAQEGGESMSRRLFNRKPVPEMVEQETPTLEQPDAGTVEQGTEVEAETPVAEPEHVEPLPVEEVHKYFIIAGSFKNLKNASDLQDHLKARGFKAEVMVTENRMYRVSVASYAGKEEANRGLYQITSEPGLENCWLLSN